MAKSIILAFSQDGALVQGDSSAVGIRQGDANGEVTIVANFVGHRNDENVAKFHFERPDGKKQSGVLMSPGDAINSFKYSVLPSWFFAVPGAARITVTITDGNGAVAAQGSYSFNIESTEVVVDDSTITYDEEAELEGLISAFGENSLKRATQITLGAGATADDFYNAVIQYAEANEIELKDGDRFYGTSVNPTTRITRAYVGEMFGGGNEKMFIVRREYITTATAVRASSASVYVGQFDAGTNEYKTYELAKRDYVDSFFNSDRQALEAVADKNGNDISAFYAPVSRVDTIENALNSLFSAEGYTFGETGMGEIFDAEVPARTNGVFAKLDAENIYSGTQSYNAPVYIRNAFTLYSGIVSKNGSYETMYLLPADENTAGKTYTIATYEDLKTSVIDLEGYAHDQAVAESEAAASALRDEIVAGTVTAGKAKRDANGLEISVYYMRKDAVYDGLDSTSAALPLSANSGRNLRIMIDNIYALLGSDDTDLDQLQEIVDYIKNNKSLIDGITTSKISYSDIIDNLESNDARKPLSANQGRIIKGLIDGIDTDKLGPTDVVDNLTTQTALKPLSAKQGYVLKGITDQLDHKIDDETTDIPLNHLSNEVRTMINAKSAFMIEYKETESAKYPGVTLPYYELIYTEAINVTSTPSSKYPGVNLPTIQIVY